MRRSVTTVWGKWNLIFSHKLQFLINAFTPNSSKVTQFLKVVKSFTNWSAEYLIMERPCRRDLGNSWKQKYICLFPQATSTRRRRVRELCVLALRTSGRESCEWCASCCSHFRGNCIWYLLSTRPDGLRLSVFRLEIYWISDPVSLPFTSCYGYEFEFACTWQNAGMSCSLHWSHESPNKHIERVNGVVHVWAIRVLDFLTEISRKYCNPLWQMIATIPSSRPEPLHRT
jgi:hypothetical protein